MIVRWETAPDARLRLVCFPYAGGSAGIYRGWARTLSPGAEVLAVELPGRGRRFREPPHRRLGAMVAEAASVVWPFLDRPFALFGHSMGALLAFEVARELRRRGAPAPDRLLISGAAAPHTPRRGRTLHTLGDDDLIAALRDLDGTPRQVLESREILDLVLPILRADFEVCETYRCTREPPLGCPISAFGGRGDRFVSAPELESWRSYTSTGFTLQMVPGGHFFVADHPRFLPVLGRELLPVPSLVPSRPGSAHAETAARSG